MIFGIFVLVGRNVCLVMDVEKCVSFLQIQILSPSLQKLKHDYI
nr:MAG TPA: hypothetical protein [Caudoviricetes sp.]